MENRTFTNRTYVNQIIVKSSNFKRQPSLELLTIL